MAMKMILEIPLDKNDIIQVEHMKDYGRSDNYKIDPAHYAYTVTAMLTYCFITYLNSGGRGVSILSTLPDIGDATINVSDLLTSPLHGEKIKGVTAFYAIAYDTNKVARKLYIYFEGERHNLDIIKNGYIFNNLILDSINVDSFKVIWDFFDFLKADVQVLHYTYSEDLPQMLWYESTIDYWLRQTDDVLEPHIRKAIKFIVKKVIKHYDIRNTRTLNIESMCEAFRDDVEGQDYVLLIAELIERDRITFDMIENYYQSAINAKKWFNQIKLKPGVKNE